MGIRLNRLTIRGKTEATGLTIRGRAEATAGEEVEANSGDVLGVKNTVSCNFMHIRSCQRLTRVNRGCGLGRVRV